MGIRVRTTLQVCNVTWIFIFDGWEIPEENTIFRFSWENHQTKWTIFQQNVFDLRKVLGYGYSPRKGWSILIILLKWAGLVYYGIPSIIICPEYVWKMWGLPPLNQTTNQPAKPSVGKRHRRVLEEKSRTSQHVCPMIQMVPENLRPCISSLIEYLDNWTAIFCLYLW